MDANGNNFSAPDVPVSEPPRTVGDVAALLGRSTTAIKKLAVEIHAPIQRTPGGVWIFSPEAVEKLRQEIQRREVEAARR